MPTTVKLSAMLALGLALTSAPGGAQTPMAPSGIYNSDYGQLVFICESESLCLGYYALRGRHLGRLIAQILPGNVVAGTWHEPGGLEMCDYARQGTLTWGTFRFTFDQDWRSWDGVWADCESWEMERRWDGERENLDETGPPVSDQDALAGNWSVTESNAADTPIWTAAFLRDGMFEMILDLRVYDGTWSIENGRLVLRAEGRVADWDFEFVGEGRNAFRISYDGEWFVFSRSP